MKNTSLLFLQIIVLFSCSLSFSQTAIYWAKNKKSISSEEFHEKWKSPKYARWNHINKSGQEISQLVSPEYKSLKINYPTFSSSIEQNTNQTFNDQTVFVIGYYFFEDLCNDSHQWTKNRVKKQKKFIASWKRTIESEYPNTVFLVFFDEKIKFANNPFNKQGYFFKDQNNWLREALFTARALCGAFAIIKPDGNAMVKNGEYSVIEIQKWLNSEK